MDVYGKLKTMWMEHGKSFLSNSLEDFGYFHKVLLVSTNVIYNLAHIFDIQHILLSFMKS